MEIMEYVIRFFYFLMMWVSSWKIENFGIWLQWALEGKLVNQCFHHGIRLFWEVFHCHNFYLWQSTDNAMRLLIYSDPVGNKTKIIFDDREQHLGDRCCLSVEYISLLSLQSTLALILPFGFHTESVPRYILLCSFFKL